MNTAYVCKLCYGEDDNLWLRSIVNFSLTTKIFMSCPHLLYWSLKLEYRYLKMQVYIST